VVAQLSPGIFEWRATGINGFNLVSALCGMKFDIEIDARFMSYFSTDLALRETRRKLFFR
jgi:hypothetical protein